MPNTEMSAGELGDAVFLHQGKFAPLLEAAARSAAGLFRPTKRSEVVWVRGDAHLAVGLRGIDLTCGHGTVVITLPVRSDQTGPTEVRVTFVVGSEDEPAGLFAATSRHPEGPAVIVAAWGENLVAFAWQLLLRLVSEAAGDVGKDARGNLLVPAEMVANADGIRVVPMARFHFRGSAGL